MATRIFLRTLTSKTLTQTLILSPRSFSTTTTNTILRLRPLITAATLRHAAAVIPTSSRAFSTRQTTSSLNDPNPNWSNRPPKETILLDGCDFEHWLVVVEKPEGEPTRDEIIDTYINTLAKVVGSYDEARMKIYSVSTRCYYAFGALVSEEDSYKLKELPGVRWVLPDSYLDVKNKDYGGEPFIDGVAVPYDPKYHEEWIRNNARANERNRRNDRPRNFDRSRNFERRRENMQTNRSPPGGGPPSNMGGPPNAGGAPPPPSGNMGGMQQGGGMGGPPPPGNMGGMQQGGGMGGPPPPGNMGGMQQGGGMGGPPNAGGGQPNWGAPRPNYNAGPPNMGGGMPPPNMGGGMPNNAPNYQQQQPPRYGLSGGAPYQSGPGPNSGGMPYQSGPGQNSGGSYQSGPGPNSGGQSYQSGPGPNSYAPNAGGGNPYQTQDMPGRDVPPPPHYSQNY